MKPGTRNPKRAGDERPVPRHKGGFNRDEGDERDGENQCRVQSAVYRKKQSKVQSLPNVALYVRLRSLTDTPILRYPDTSSFYPLYPLYPC